MCVEGRVAESQFATETTEYLKIHQVTMRGCSNLKQVRSQRYVFLLEYHYDLLSVKLNFAYR